MRYAAIALALGIGVILLVTPVAATVIVCPADTESRLNTGSKVHMHFRVGVDTPEMLEPALREFASVERLHLTTLEGQAGSAAPKAIFLFSNDVDGIYMHVNIDGDGTAEAELSTGAYTCVAPKDWRPYWRDFEVLIQKRHYKRLSPVFSPR